MKSSAPKKKYFLKKLFGTLLWGRHMAVDLRDRILKAAPEEVEVNFENVEFMTRAFADEYLKVKAFLEKKGMKVVHTSMTPEVDQMLKHVKRPVV